MKDIDGRFQVIVYSGRIGDEADTFSFEAFEVLFFQNLNTGFDFYFLCLYGEGQQAAGAKNNKSEFVHKYLCFESLLFYFWVSLISSVSSFLP